MQEKNLSRLCIQNSKWFYVFFSSYLMSFIIFINRFLKIILKIIISFK